MAHVIAITVALYIAWIFYDALRTNVIPDSPEVVEPDISEAFYTDYFDNKN